MCLEARSVADSKTSLIMSHSERFKSLFKRFYSIKNALNILFIAGHDKLHMCRFAYLVNQQTFGPFGI